MSRNQTLVVSIAALIFIASVVLIYFFLFVPRYMRDDDGQFAELNNPYTNDERAIIEDNKDVLEEARSYSGSSLRPIGEEDNTRGNQDASVQIIVYSDFECPFCLDFNQELNKVIENFGDKVLIAYRHYFLNSHKNALEAAQAAECAADQGKYLEMHEKLFEANENNKLTREYYEEVAKELGLDVVKFSKCLYAEEHKERAINQMLEAKSMGIIGTPTIFINNEILPGAYPYEDFVDQKGEKQLGLKSRIENKLGLVD